MGCGWLASWDASMPRNRSRVSLSIHVSAKQCSESSLLPCKCFLYTYATLTSTDAQQRLALMHAVLVKPMAACYSLVYKLLFAPNTTLAVLSNTMSSSVRETSDGLPENMHDLTNLVCTNRCVADSVTTIFVQNSARWSIQDPFKNSGLRQDVLLRDVTSQIAF
jgi:hypothetical protein